MQIQIIAMGRVKEAYLSKGIAEYEKRLRPYVKLGITDIAEEKRPVRLSPAQKEQLLDREGARILASVPPGSYSVGLVVTGKGRSSEALSALLHEQQMNGTRHLTFIIGGDLGLSNDVLARCDEQLSLSPMTFTHQMVRLILLEQVYRAFRIMRGEPYHK
jgi:23S rRNA (pseudouridine1915-N3)-methyltransferase